MELALRTYRLADELKLVELWNRAYAEYGGIVTRSVEYWKWTILARPEVRHEDILIVETHATPVGYGVLWRNGAVLEIAIDPDLSTRRRRRVLAQLIAALEKRAQERGDDALTCSLPVSDRMIDKFLRDAGYVVDQHDFISVGILNPQELIRRLLTFQQSRLPKNWRRTFSIEITPGEYRYVVNGRLRIVVDSTIAVEQTDAAPNNADCTIRAELNTLAELIFGETKLNTLLSAGRVSVEPKSLTNDARKLLSALIISRPWYMPLSDAF